jgi:cobalt-zinc-cadmium efflux system membrane fusion protein
MATLSELNPRVNVAPAVVSAAVEPERSSLSSRWKDLLAMASRWSTALVLAVLAGLAFWGHHSGWKLPKFSALFTAPTGKEDWCDEHNVPESICVVCNDRVPNAKHYDWCSVHGVHDCPLEHPDVAQLKQPPQVTQADLDRAQRALALKERAENSRKCQMHKRCIQFASKEVMEKMGVEPIPAWEAPILEAVAATGEITAAQPQVAPLYTPVAGRVWQVTEKAKLGAFVKEGEVLALIDSVEIGKAKAGFLQALALLDSRAKSVESMRSLVPTAVSPARFREEEAVAREAEVKVFSAQQSMANLGLPIRYEDIKHLTSQQLNDHVRFLGLPPEIARAISATTTTTNLVAVKASRNGYVKEVNAVKDVMVGPSQPLFVVVDTRQMWLTLNVRIEDVKYLRIRDAGRGTPGQAVRFRAEGRDEEVNGELVWKSTSVDDTTRAVQFRAELPNADGSLLANTFGTGQIILREEKKSTVVPNDALHWEGDCHIVFVRDRDFLDEGAPKVFHVRSVRPGVKNGPYTEIIAGLLPGEVVAGRNSATLRAQLLKNNLGAG